MINKEKLKEFIINLLNKYETEAGEINCIDSDDYPEIADKITENISQ
jgi:ribose 5-phosphate isomerase RpiB